jgi:hypothetical protein
MAIRPSEDPAMFEVMMRAAKGCSPNTKATDWAIKLKEKAGVFGSRLMDMINTPSTEGREHRLSHAIQNTHPQV